MNINDVIKQTIDNVKLSLTQKQLYFLHKVDKKYFDILQDEIYETYCVNSNILSEYSNIDLNLLNNNTIIPMLQDNIASKKITIYNGSYIPAEFCLRAINLQTIKISNGIEIIHEDAFSDCLQLKKIIIPKSIKSIYNHAFNNCISLKQLILPKTLEFIGNNAFKNCLNLKKLYFV